MVGVVLVASGIAGVTWTVRTGHRVATGERQELRARGLDDGLPMGAFLQGQRVGLEASDQWLVFATLLVGVGLLFGVGGAIDPQVGWRFGLAFGSGVGFLPAAILFRVGTGTKLWLTSDGIDRGRWPRRSVRWIDVERIVPLRRGTTPSALEDADAFELRLPHAAQRRSRFSRANTFAIPCRLLEISSADLFRMIEERATPAPSRL